MTPIAKILVLATLAAMVGCTSHAVRCEERLEAVNAPRAKPTRGADAASSAASSAASGAASSAAPSAEATPPAATPPSGP